MNELQIQAKLYQTAVNTWPVLRGCFFSVPNGGKRDPREATQLKASGLVAGVPDMILLHKGNCYGFELKTETGKLSPAQTKVHAAWAGQGVHTFLVRNVAHGLLIIEGILKG